MFTAMLHSEGIFATFNKVKLFLSVLVILTSIGLGAFSYGIGQILMEVKKLQKVE